MALIYRILIPLVLLFAAFSAYSAGNRTGLFIFVLLGVVCEAAFWFNLFPIKRKRAN